MNKGDFRVSFGRSEKRGQGAKERRREGMPGREVRGGDTTIPASANSQVLCVREKPFTNTAKQESKEPKGKGCKT